ncbi:MAG TPA: M1 family metallopeptidase [Kofleriaceae bacterium]|nr:M1 family metallopeptidase [Kofleriaceae bacterium]
MIWSAVSCHAGSGEPTPGPAMPPIARPIEPAIAPPAAPPSAPAPAGDAVPLGPLPTGVRPLHESLALEIDPDASGFRGTAEIALRFEHPSDHVWLHGRGLTVRAAEVTTASGARLAARWEERDPLGVVRVTLPSAVSGDATLRVAFEAGYDAQLAGVYRVRTSVGPAVFSKFEAIYARRAFPCFDEPAFKIPYDIALTVPRADAVIGNMPIARETVGPTTRRVELATTPPLPAYLVAFAVGPFDSHGATIPPGPMRPAALPVSAVAMRGRGHETAYALAEERDVLLEQERYFGVAFPYPKLDLVAVPDFQSGAMENAGAITFRDSLLLVDDKVASLDRRIAVTGILAHETAHQWFGDLVTMPWWDDLWLNEGFATFFATRTLRAVRPRMESELRAAMETDAVMASDSLASARRIRQPIETAHDITNAFDSITYDKSAAVLAMLEHFVGDDRFRSGLHAFLTEHRTGNATTADLVRALSTAAGRDLAPLVGSFIDQPGVPIVTARARCEAGRGSVELTQARWRPVGSTLSSDARWTIPVCVRAGIGNRVEDACTVLGAQAGSLALPGCASWIMPNAQGAGYYRSALAQGELAQLLAHASQLLVVERVTLANDLAAAFHSASLPGGDVLRALEPFAADPHGAVAQIPLALFKFVDGYLVEGNQRARLRAHVARLYAPQVRSLGWKPSAGEPPWRRLFRATLLEFLALEIEDPAVLDEAARRGRRVLGLDPDRARHPDAVEPDLAALARAAAVRRGGAGAFDAVMAELSGSEDAPVRQRALEALASTREPALIGRALDLALDPQLRQNERVITLRILLGAIDTRDVAWAWLKAHFDELARLLPDRYAGQLPRQINLCDASRTADVRAFFASRADKLTGGPRNLAQAIESAELCVARVAAQRDSVRAYIP